MILCNVAIDDALDAGRIILQREPSWCWARFKQVTQVLIPFLTAPVLPEKIILDATQGC